MPTLKKEQTVAQLRGDLAESAAVYLAETTGLDVAEMYELRGQLLQAGARMQIAKNTLIKLAIQDTGAEGLNQFLTGPSRGAPQSRAGAFVSLAN